MPSGSGAASLGTAASPASSDSPASAADWPVYHRDALRTGDLPSFPAPRDLRIAWSRSLDGAVYAQPLVVQGRLLFATEGDSVYALNPSNGSVDCRRHLGAPVPLASLPCGDIDPLGITGTPAYDPATGFVFAVAEVSGPRHMLFALDPSTGVVRWSREVDPPGIDPTVLQQRAALAVGYGLVYVAFGGLDGDCGAYHGAIVSVPTSGRGGSVTYRVPTAREGGIWATGGPVLDGLGNVYVSVGNGSSTTTWDGSDSVLELSSTLRLRSSFAPSSWASDNAGDLDLGSLSPTLLPGGRVFIAGKGGTGYVLRQGALGGIGGQQSDAVVCRAFGGTAVGGSAGTGQAGTGSAGTGQAGAITTYVPCVDGLRAVSIDSAGRLRVRWHTATGADGPPVVAGAAVYALDLGAGILDALDPATGAVMAHIGVGGVPHFASPTPWSHSVFVGTMVGVSAVSVGS